MNSLGQDLGVQLFAWSATALAHGLALFALVWATERLGLLRRPGLRQTAWRTVLLAPLLSAALQVFVLGGSPIGRLLPAAATPAIAMAEPAAAPVAMAEAAPMAAPAIDPDLLYQGAALLGWAWLALVAAGAARLAVQRYSLRRYRRRLMAVSDPATVAMARALGRHAGLTDVRLLDDPDLASPIALAPRVVVLPGWTRDAFSDLQRKALLAHEIRHLARRDPQWRALTGLTALATLAPHGGAVLRRLEDLAEYACDAWSAGQTGAGQPLAECLAACMERGLGRRTPAGVAAMARPSSSVVDRVRRLLTGRAEGFETSVWVERAMLAAAIGAAALILPGLTLGRGDGADPTVRLTPVSAFAAEPTDPEAARADAVAARADADAARADARAAATGSVILLADARAARADLEAIQKARADADAARADADTAKADEATMKADAETARADEATAQADEATMQADAAAAKADEAAAKAGAPRGGRTITIYRSSPSVAVKATAAARAMAVAKATPAADAEAVAR